MNQKKGLWMIITILSRFQPSTRKFAKGIPNLKQQQMGMIVLLDLFTKNNVKHDFKKNLKL